MGKKIFDFFLNMLYDLNRVLNLASFITLDHDFRELHWVEYSYIGEMDHVVK